MEGDPEAARLPWDARPVARELAAALVDLEASEEAKPDEGEPLLAEALLRDALREGATDLHLDPEGETLGVRLRIDGRLVPGARLPFEVGMRLAGQFKSLALLDPVTAFRPEEARRTVTLGERELDLRLVAVPCLGGHKLALRLLEPSAPRHGLDTLGLRDDDRARVERWFERRAGMCLVTGPTGSGKTTTLYALVRHLDPARRSLLTIEDPIEYRIEGATQVQVDEAHGLGFGEGLRTLLRMDPDGLLVGEIRDAGSARMVVRATASGHALMSSLHSRDAVGAVTALRARELGRHEIAVTLGLVVSQRLVRTLCPDCGTTGPPEREEAAWLEAQGVAAPERVGRARGCEGCRGEGYRGRTGLFEVWEPDRDAREWILEGASEATLRERLRERGHRTLLDDGLEKAAAGRTTLAELRDVPDVVDPGS